MLISHSIVLFRSKAASVFCLVSSNINSSRDKRRQTENEQQLTGSATLTHIVEESVMRRLHGRLQVHISKDDVGRFPTQLQRDPLEGTRCVALDQLAHFRRTCGYIKLNNEYLQLFTTTHQFISLLHEMYSVRLAR